MPGTPVPYPSAVERFPRLRQSILANFDACNLLARFELEYRDGWSGHPQARGIIFHRFAAKALQQMAELGENMIDPEDALAILRETLRQHDVDDRDVVAIPFAQVKDLRWVAIKWAHENVFDVGNLADLEQRLTAIVRYPNPEGGWVEREISGRLDALWVPEPDWAVVVDWKDTWAVPRENELSEGGYFQQRFYALLIFHRYPSIERVTLREVYVRKRDEATEVAPVREATLFRSELPNLEDEMAALVERFDRAWERGTWPLPGPAKEVELWKPSPGAHCSFCPRPGACPIFPDARVRGAITDAETAERWAAEQIVAKAAVDQRDKGLRAWAGNRGPIPVKHAKDPNRVLGYRSAKRTSRPTKEALERALREQGAALDPATLYETRTVDRFGQHTHEDPGDAPEDVELTRALEESVRRAEQSGD